MAPTVLNFCLAVVIGAQSPSIVPRLSRYRAYILPYLLSYRVVADYGNVSRLVFRGRDRGCHLAEGTA
jgi:hypothetical protein